MKKYCNRKPFLLLSVFLFSVAIATAQKKASAKNDRPNIVIINMDDMGYGDPVCYGGGPYQTPQIDALAAHGIRFTNFYSAQAVCTTSRSALMTGCYPTRIGISGAIDHNAKFALNPNEETLAELLKKAGYTTGIVGKWHLGHKEPYLPLQNGFDEFLGLPYSNDMWAYDYNGERWKDTSFWRAKYPPLPLIEGNKTIKIISTFDDQDSLTTLYTQRALSFIERNKKQPFFLYLAHSMVHVPLGVSNRFKGKSGAGMFGDVMEEVDWSVGEVVRSLKANGVYENTIIVFTSDNGPWLTFGNHAGNTAGLREGKGTAWDGGLRVPCIISWPGHTSAATINNHLLTNMDILPTMATIAHAAQPVKKIDGVDFSAFLVGEVGSKNDQVHKNKASPHSAHDSQNSSTNKNTTTLKSFNPRDEFAYYYDKNNLKAIRKGYWKLVFAASSQTYGPPATIGADRYPGNWGGVELPMALYNLAIDPGEDRDVKEQYPKIVTELQQIADKYRQALGDGLTNTEGKEVRPAAKLD